MSKVSQIQQVEGISIMMESKTINPLTTKLTILAAEASGKEVRVEFLLHQDKNRLIQIVSFSGKKIDQAFARSILRLVVGGLVESNAIGLSSRIEVPVQLARSLSLHGKESNGGSFYRVADFIRMTNVTATKQLQQSQAQKGTICGARTLSGRPCKMRVSKKGDRCEHHGAQKE